MAAVAEATKVKLLLRSEGAAGREEMEDLAGERSRSGLSAEQATEGEGLRRRGAAEV